MARTDGLYIESVTLGGIPDGGDVEFEVVTPSGSPVSKIGLTVSSSQTSVDLSTQDVAAWPNEIRLKLNATEGDAFKSVTLRNRLGMVEFFRDYVGTTTPVLNDMGITLVGSAHTFSWSDQNPVGGRRYQIAINGIAKSGSVVEPVVEWFVSGLPVDGSIINVELSYWDNEDLNTLQSVSGTVTAHTEATGVGSRFIIPASNIAEGSYGSQDWNAAIEGAQATVWDSAGDAVASITAVSGRRAFGVRLDNTTVPSTRVGGTSNLTPNSKASFQQWVHFDAGFDWGGTSQGGKLGFGLGGGARPLDGPAVSGGFASRFTWGTNGALFVQALTGGGPSDGTYYPLNITASRGVWFKLRMDVEMNSLGNSDGKLTVSHNDSTVLTRSDIEWFDAGTPQVDVLQHYTHHGGTGAAWSPDRVNRISYSSIFWAIGSQSLPLAEVSFISPTPASGQAASSASVTFSWQGGGGYVYDLHVYSDAARTQKVVDNNGAVMDTNGIGTNTSHTFPPDPGDGLPRYARLYWWPDESYTGGGYIDRDYFSYSSTVSELTLVVEWTEDEEVVIVEPTGPPIYVSTTGSDANSGATTGAAKRTIQAAVDIATSGNKVYVKAGNYGAVKIVSKAAGTASEPIVIEGYQTTPGDRPNHATFDHLSSFDSALMPVLNFGNRLSGTDNTCITINHSYVYVRGFQVREYTYGLTTATGITGNVFQNIYIDDIGDYNYYSGGPAGYRGTGAKFNGASFNCNDVVVVNATGEGISTGPSSSNGIITNSHVWADTGLEPLNEFQTPQTGDQGTDYYSVIQGTGHHLSGCSWTRVGDLGHNGHGCRLQSASNVLLENCTGVHMRGGAFSFKDLNGPCEIRDCTAVGAGPTPTESGPNPGAGQGIYLHTNTTGVTVTNLNLVDVYTAAYLAGYTGDLTINGMSGTCTSYIFQVFGGGTRENYDFDSVDLTSNALWYIWDDSIVASSGHLTNCNFVVNEKYAVSDKSANMQITNVSGSTISAPFTLP